MDMEASLIQHRVARKRRLENVEDFDAMDVEDSHEETPNSKRIKSCNLDGKVPPYGKSEPIPEVNDGPVKVVVADSLQDVVFNSGKNVLLEFCSPFCGHCRVLAPILDEVAASYESDPDVVIAKLDATANDIPGDFFDIKGYPVVYLRSVGGKLVQYEGDRTKEDIINFIEKNRN